MKVRTAISRWSLSILWTLFVLVVLSACGPRLIFDPARRSAAIIVLPGAEGLSYHHDFKRNSEGARYEVACEPLAVEQVETVRSELRSQGWREIENPVDSAWREMFAVGAPSGSGPEKVCSFRSWSKGGETVSYSMCSRVPERTRLEVGIWRRPIEPTR